MAIPRLFRLPQHREFNYVPRYFDPEKAEREERLKQLKKEREINEFIEENEGASSRIKGNFNHYFYRSKRVRKQSNLRLLIIVIGLMILSYYLFFT